MPRPRWTTAPNVMEIVIDGTLSGRDVAIVLHVDYAGFTGFGDDMASLVLSSFQEHILPQLDGALLINGARYRDRNTLIGETGVVGPDPLFNTGGGKAGDGTTRAVAYLVTKNTSTLTGEKPGRMYLPGVTEDVVNQDGTLEPSFRDDLQDGCTAFLTRIQQPDLPLVVVHNDDNSEVGRPTHVPTLSVDAEVATQRRRQR